MAVKKLYEFAEVKAAIDTANHHFYKQLLMVRSDVSNQEFSQKKVTTHPATATSPAWTGRGSDTGHAFRHVDGTQEVGKSIYEDEFEMVMCTRELLNSAAGQKVLGQLDADYPSGDMDSSKPPPRIKGAITGSYYGFASGSTDKKRIKSAVCVVMKLGTSTLWIHTTYPDAFI